MRIIRYILARVIGELVKRRPVFLSQALLSTAEQDERAFRNLLDRLFIEPDAPAFRMAIGCLVKRDPMGLMQAVLASYATANVPRDSVIGPNEPAFRMLLARFIKEDPKNLILSVIESCGTDAASLESVVGLVTSSPEYTETILAALFRNMDVQGTRYLQDRILKASISDCRLPSWSREFGYVIAAVELHSAWSRLKRYLKTDSELVNMRWQHAFEKITTRHQVPELLPDVFESDGKLPLMHCLWEFPDRRSMWCLLHEILVEEEYFFTADSPQPRIIDAGSHCGLAIYYFKTLYPSAHITAFEPVPRLREMALRNVERGAYEDVVILPYALSRTRGKVHFHLSSSDSMAGSVEHFEADAIPEGCIEVETVPLSAYLNEPVDMLKLDIEGEELDVLQEAAEKLTNVRNVFCEFHYRPSSAATLGQVVSILEAAGHVVRVAESWSTRQQNLSRPLARSGQPESLILWGQRAGASLLPSSDEAS